MTTPGGTGIPALDDLARRAAALGVDVSAQIIKAVDIMGPNPVDIGIGMERLAAVTGGLDVSQQGLQRDGVDAMSGAAGQSADAFVPHSAQLNNGLTNSSAGITQVAETLDAARKAFTGAQETVKVITSSTLAALRVMGM